MAKELYLTSLFNDTNLLSYYRLEGNANDSKGSNNGTAINVTYGTDYGRFGQGASFNGSSSYIDFPNNPGWTSYTVHFWIYRNTLSVAIPISKDLLGASNRTFSFETNADATATAYAWNASNTIYGVNFSGITQNAWHMIDIVWDSGAGYLIPYIDGVAGTSTAISGNAKSDASKLTLGRQNTTTPGKYFSGYLDDVALFSRALSSTEISNLYNMGPSGIFFHNYL